MKSTCFPIRYHTYTLLRPNKYSRKRKNKIWDSSNLLFMSHLTTESLTKPAQLQLLPSLMNDQMKRMTKKSGHIALQIVFRHWSVKAKKITKIHGHDGRCSDRDSNLTPTEDKPEALPPESVSLLWCVEVPTNQKKKHKSASTNLHAEILYS